MRLTEEGIGVDVDELLDVADEPVHVFVPARFS
jgi:hypothetical protein